MLYNFDFNRSKLFRSDKKNRIKLSFPTKSCSIVYKWSKAPEMELLLVFVRFLGSSSTIPNAHIAIVMIFVYLNGMIYRPQSADYLVQPGHKSHNKPSTQNGQKQPVRCARHCSINSIVYLLAVRRSSKRVEMFRSIVAR